MAISRAPARTTSGPMGQRGAGLPGGRAKGGCADPPLRPQMNQPIRRLSFIVALLFGALLASIFHPSCDGRRRGRWSPAGVDSGIGG